MTRITFQWMLIFIIGGNLPFRSWNASDAVELASNRHNVADLEISRDKPTNGLPQEVVKGILLFVSGEPTVPSTSEAKTPNSVSPLILSPTGNTSSEFSSNSVDSKTENTHEELESFVSTASNNELVEASRTSVPLDGNKTHNSVFSEVLSTEVLTTLLSTDPSNESSKPTNSESSTGGYNDQQEMVSNPKDHLSSDNESYTDIDVQNAENVSDKSPISTSNEVSENSKIFKTTDEIQSGNDSLSTKSSVQKVSYQTEYSISPSSLEIFTHERDPTITELTKASEPIKRPEGQTTDSGKEENHSEENSPSQINITQSSDGNTAESTLAVSESTKYLETETTDKTAYEDLSTEDSLSLHKTTPKSATKKRSLNNTGDSILHRETTAASDTFDSTSNYPELVSLLEHGDSSTSESIDGTEILTKSNISETMTLKESDIPETNKYSEEELSTLSIPGIASELGTIGDTNENREKIVDKHSNPEKSSNSYLTMSVNEHENMGEKETSEIKMEIEKSVNPTSHSEAFAIIPKVSDDYSHLNNLDNVDNTFTGVTFDPDGMKNSEPQDPDSVVFYVPSTNFDKVSTPENSIPSTAFTEHESSEDEREFEFVTHKNLEEGGNHGNVTSESERMEYIPQDKSVNISHQPTHNATDTSEIVTFETKNTSNSSSFVFWDPSNGGWILPGSATDTQIKRIDEALNNESEEMLQDAPHFPDTNSSQNKSPSSDLKIEPKEILKTTIEDGTSSVSKDLETETVTELGFVGFSNSFVPRETDQSVIRPVKIKLTSPDDKSVFTSILPESFSTLAPEQPIGLKLSEPTAGPMIEKIETSSTNTSSPIILPNPAPSVITEIVKNPELSTIAIQPELVPISLDIKTPEVTGTPNGTSVANSTIAGIAVKTSVSVSLPLSKKNDSQALQPMIEELLKKMNASSLSINGSSISILPYTSVPSVSTPSEASTDGLTITSDQTTTTTGFKIRKPKIKIPGASDSGTPRPYRPFSPSPKRPTTTAGPPVSIFKKQRTRIASITSSTTARPLRPYSGGNFATVRIQFASDIPGLLPQEFLISTEPVTTTTTEPTTTEEPISEVPFTDQTHIPTVVNEDDVTLVKVAGYVVIDRGLRWNDLLHNRHSPEYKMNAEAMHLYLERMFRSSPIASRLWKIEIDGFSGNKKTRPVGVDFFLYLIKTRESIPTEHLATVFHEKLSVNNTFGTFRVDTSKTAFEMIQEQPLKAPTPPPEEENVEPPIPQWAIAVIVIGAASLIFIVLFAAVTIYGRHHMRRRYSSKLSEEDMERSSGEWESKMAAAYENMAADTIYDAEDLHSDSYKKSSRIATFHGIPSTLKRCDSWSSNGWTTPPKRKRPQVH